MFLHHLGTSRVRSFNFGSFGAILYNKCHHEIMELKIEGCIGNRWEMGWVYRTIILVKVSFALGSCINFLFLLQVM